jgi:uncharacterized RDD family membrane protein YckC
MSSNSSYKPNEEKTVAGPFKQVLVGLVDIALAVLLASLVLMYRTPWPLYQLLYSINPVVLIVLWVILYRLLCLMLMNGTIGMKLLGVVLLNGEEQPLTFKEKLLAAIFILYQGVEYYNR